MVGLYEQAQACTMVLPRLYLLNTVGACYILSKEAPARVSRIDDRWGQCGRQKREGGAEGEERGGEKKGEKRERKGRRGEKEGEGLGERGRETEGKRDGQPFFGQDPMVGRRCS